MVRPFNRAQQSKSDPIAANPRLPCIGTSASGSAGVKAARINTPKSSLYPRPPPKSSCDTRFRPSLPAPAKRPPSLPPFTEKNVPPCKPQSKLGAALRAKGEDEGETFATKDTIRDVIKEAFPELEARQLHALESLADQREDGRWGFANIEKWGFGTLQEVQDQHILLKSIKPPRLEQVADATQQ